MSDREPRRAAKSAKFPDSAKAKAAKDRQPPRRPAPRRTREQTPAPERRPRRVEPALPEDVTGAELDRAIRAELGSLAAMNAERVAQHLVVAGRLLDDDPEQAYAHAVAARDRAGRVGAVREAAGLAAYRTGRYAEALADLRAARRITGDQSLLPVLADCERGLGRPERAIEIAGSKEAKQLDAAGRAELLMVASGARRDLGQPQAAVLLLQGADLNPARRRPWSARMFYAYSEALREAGRAEEADEWLRHAADADEAGETDAAQRLGRDDGVVFLDEG